MKQCIGFLLWFFMTHVYAALTLQVDTSKISLDQTFRLTLSQEGVSQSSLPDLLPLRRDFTLVGTERSMNYTLINGKATSLSQWVIILKPKHTGQLVIPSIRLGHEQTPQSKIEVVEEDVLNPEDSGVSQNVKIKVEVSNQQPYIHEQVLYTVKMYYQRQFMDAQFQPPVVQDALMVPFGEPRRYQAMEDDTPYVIEEQQFAIFPQKSGDMTIKPPRFQGLIFDSLPQKVKTRGQPVTLHVKPSPAGTLNHPWLPAKELNLSEKYEPQGQTLKSGDMVTRTVTLKAWGAPGQLLPKLTFSSDNYFSAYPETPQEKTFIEKNNLLGVIKFKVNYLFNQPGHITIPELRMEWFNTQTGRFETAILPARTMTVAAAANQAMPPPAVQQPAPVLTNATQPQPTEAPLAASVPSKFSMISWLGWIAAGLFALLWVATLFVRKKSNAAVSLKQVKEHLRQACLQSDPVSAKNALLAWAKIIWPHAHIMNLEHVMGVTQDPILNGEIQSLSEALYPSNPRSWEGESLWRAVEAFHQKKTEKPVKPSVLPPLNPD